MRALPVLILALVAATASAQESIYVGIGFANFDYSENTGDPLLGTVSDTALNKKFFGGFEINDNFTLEISYAKTDDLVDSKTALFFVDADDIPDAVTATLRTDFTITTLSAIGQVPFDWGAFMGGVGYFTSDSGFFADAFAPCCDLSLSNSGSISDNGLMAMLALEWRFGRFGARYGIRLEYEWWDMSNIDSSALGIGVSYGF